MQTHMSMRPKVQLQPIPHTTPSHGIFELRCDNSKKRAGKPVVYITAFGSMYPDGTVHVHTRSLQVTDFTTLRQMLHYLQELGECRITWIAGPLAKQVEEEGYERV